MKVMPSISTQYTESSQVLVYSPWHLFLPSLQTLPSPSTTSPLLLERFKTG